MHRVQRVPVTEASGRIHTSTATVSVLPEADEVEIQIPDKDLRIDVYRSSGPGGQSVNTTDSAVRITHLPSGLVVAIQDEKSQHKNKAKAMAVLRARLLELEQQRLAEERGEQRRSQVGSGERAEKIRTYNFPDDRVTDHRVGLTVHNLPGLLQGDLDRLVDPLAEADQAARLAERRRRGARMSVAAAGRCRCGGCPLTAGGTPPRRCVLRARRHRGWTPSCWSSHAFGRDRSWLHAHPEAELDRSDLEEAAGGWIERRATGEPIAYIRGFKEWLSLRILTDRRALIPRPETELLAEAAIGEIAARLVDEDAPDTPIAAWEVGTGSGAVALALALRFRTSLALGRLRLGATDLSPEALELAEENLVAHGVDGLVSLGCGDLLEPPVLPAPQQPDVILANLPYLTSAEVAEGAGSLQFEPHLALDGGA